MTMLSLLLLIFVVHSTAWAQDITTGMTLWYKFDDGSGTAPVDSSGAGRTGALAGTQHWQTAANCKVVTCLGFVKADSNVVTLGVDLVGTLMTVSAGTLAAWVNPHSAAVDHPTNVFALEGIIVDNNNNLGITRGTIASANDGFWFFNWPGAYTSMSVPYTLNTWVHLVWVHGGGQLTAYKNGVVSGSPITSGNTGSGSAQTRIGANSASNFSTAEIDEVRVYNRALTAADVTALFQVGQATLGNRWRMMQRERWDKTLARWLFAGRWR
jgi:hypothetical protein